MMYCFEHEIYFCLTDKVKKTGIRTPKIRMMTYNKTIWGPVNIRMQTAESIKRQTMTRHVDRCAVWHVSYFKGSS